MVIGWLSTKIVQIILIGWKTWLPGGLASFSIVNIGKTLKIFFSGTSMLLKSLDNFIHYEKHFAFQMHKIIYFFPENLNSPVN